MGAPLEGDVHAEGVQPLERIVEAVRDRLGIPAALHAVLLPEIEPAEIHSGVRHPGPSDETLRQRVPDLQVLQPQIGRVDLLQRRRLIVPRSEEHTSELQSRFDLVCRLLLEKKKKNTQKKSEGTRYIRLYWIL